MGKLVDNSISWKIRAGRYYGFLGNEEIGSIEKGGEAFCWNQKPSVRLCSAVLISISAKIIELHNDELIMEDSDGKAC